MTHDERIEANDHLLKAVVALLTIKDPTFVNQLDNIFRMAEAQGDEIARMNAQSWSHIRDELEVVRNFVHGDEDPQALIHGSVALDGKMALGSA